METRRPISEKKLLANRANARRSTGPKTLAGKEVVSKNALKHGLRSRNLRLNKSEACFDDLLLNMTGELKTAEEESLLEEIAGLRRKLCNVIQQQAYSVSRTSGPSSENSTALRLILRYEAAISREYLNK